MILTMSLPQEELLSRLRDAIAKGPRLRLLVLFGSHATGRTRASSDVDIGIVPLEADMPFGEELALASTLSAATGTEVDIVRLDDVPPLLGREVARSGVCVFEVSPGVFAAWRAGAMSRWFDFDETIAPHRARFLQRLAAGARGAGGGRP